MAASLSIVIPFFNEEGCVKQVIEEVRAAQPGAEIVAVDDGSTDKTAALLREVSDIKTVLFDQNRGRNLNVDLNSLIIGSETFNQVDQAFFGVTCH